MPDDWQMFRGIDWRQVLPFTHIFRAFRIAIHPSKLLLGLALLLSVYAGGRILDAVWPIHDQAAVDEIPMYQLAPSHADFELARNAADERVGIFISFFEYEVHEFSSVVDCVRSNLWVNTPDEPGVTGHVYYFLAIGPLWLATIHPLYALLFGILFLSAWSLFGGAISRLTAVHVARDEKISIRAATNFAMGKFLSFASAPIIPILITLAVGLLLGLASLLINIPFLGPIIVGVMFWLALLAGFVQALVILGAVGGFNLMYPTIAVEGSDSFDAISRSFSYIYARPWRMLFYTAVAVGYGALTYLFVRYFILLMLTLSHHFVAMGSLTNNSNGGPLWPSMWPSPASTGRLTYTPDYGSLNLGAKIGAGILSFWIYLIIGILGSFAISFYFAANTIIYFLLRRDLDATEMDDVYLEQSDEEFIHSTASVDQPVAGEVIVTEVVETDSTPDPAAPADEPLKPAGS